MLNNYFKIEEIEDNYRNQYKLADDLNLNIYNNAEDFSKHNLNRQIYLIHASYINHPQKQISLNIEIYSYIESNKIIFIYALPIDINGIIIQIHYNGNIIRRKIQKMTNLFDYNDFVINWKSKNKIPSIFESISNLYRAEIPIADFNNNDNENDKVYCKILGVTLNRVYYKINNFDKYFDASLNTPNTVRILDKKCKVASYSDGYTIYDKDHSGKNAGKYRNEYVNIDLSLRDDGFIECKYKFDKQDAEIEDIDIEFYYNGKTIRENLPNSSDKFLSSNNNNYTEYNKIIDIGYAPKYKYIPWDSYFMGIALMAKSRSKDPSTQVGACIVKNNRIISTGYNGFPIGCSDNEFPWEKGNESEYDNKYYYVVHAELNAILNCKVPMDNATLYVTMFPCNECIKAIIQAGIKKIIFYKADRKYLTPGSEKMLKAAKIETVKYNTINKEIKLEL